MTLSNIEIISEEIVNFFGKNSTPNPKVLLGGLKG